MTDEKDMAYVLDAGCATLKTEMLDRVLVSVMQKTPRSSREARIVSHSLQTLMYEREGYAFVDIGGKRIMHKGMEWRVDDSLPLNCVLIETEFGTGLLKNLYPFCPACTSRPQA